MVAPDDMLVESLLVPVSDVDSGVSTSVSFPTRLQHAVWCCVANVRVGDMVLQVCQRRNRYGPDGIGIRGSRRCVLVYQLISLS